MTDIREQKLIYHLTSLENMQAILDVGLLPRSKLHNFIDVADPEIINSRKGLRLENYVPFHFFAKNPFDGRVQRDRPEKRFVLIAIQRSVARANGWKIISKHPLAGDEIELHDYDAGMESIDWQVMNKRDYSNQYCKCVCMAECLAPGPVSSSLFHSILVKDHQVQLQVQNMLNGRNRVPYVDIKTAMFSQ